MPNTFDHPVLGRVIWLDEPGEWGFQFVLDAARQIPGSILLEDSTLPPEDQGFDEIADCLVWLRANEHSVRHHIGERMFKLWIDGWYDPEIDTVTTKADFCSTLALSGIAVLEDRNVTLNYADGDLFGGHFISITIDRSGKVIYEPHIWG